ncbi:MAG: ABC transporter ATP-binding protein [Candidatus Omnitrophota bacterium]|jgi:ABC-type polysaccharide/polyol phosphate transport system ATPase subunit
MTTLPIKAINSDRDEAMELKSIGKKYPHSNFWALRDISLNSEKGKILGIIGRNGAGKTTLLNIIAGVLSSTEGKVNIKGRVLGLFNLGVGFQDELSGRENIFLNGALLGAAKQELEAKLSSIIEFSELGDFINMPLGTYSQGMRLRLGFSIIANLDFDILVIDEVLAVGDALFQNKCFQRLMDFRHSGKTLIITSQSMELMERLCDKIVLLDHGRLLFQGEPGEGINKYRALLNTEKFFVGAKQATAGLVENTKKWAEDVSSWGKKLGVKEVIIDSVEMRNRFGIRCNKIKSREPLCIKVKFTVKDEVKEPHFGVAIFRDDGVYCYGPNTEFDGIEIPRLKKGKGWFELRLRQVYLAAGEYKISIAVWDKNETLAYDYHNGCYKLSIKGESPDNALLNMPYKLSYPKRDLSGSIRLFSLGREEKNTFITNEFARLQANFSEIETSDIKDTYLRLGIYRDDGVLCQNIVLPLKQTTEVIFPCFALLPGSYNISANTRDCIYPFKMAFNRQDHGTVYLAHQWSWSLCPKT